MEKKPDAGTTDVQQSRTRLVPDATTFEGRIIHRFESDLRGIAPTNGYKRPPLRQNFVYSGGSCKL